MADKNASVAGKYQLLELIARGGMAEVFRAKSYGVEGFEKTVVIKRILPEFSQNRRFVEMFINEAKISVSLSHANIVQVFDLGKDETGLYYIAMEYVAGMDLAEMLRRCLARNQAFPVELAVYCVAEACKGLDYAHRRRGPDLAPLDIVHRDISPHNLLASFEGEVKLTDFGIARAKDLVVEPSGSAVQGKFSYMAPEQASGGEVDGRADIFSLGVVLYEILTGVNPFRDATGAKTLERVQKGQALPILEAKPDLPVELRGIVETAIAPKPDDRHQNASRFYEDLIAFLYSSGLRVGAHDLTQFVQTLRESPRPSDDAARDLIDILDRPAGSTSAPATGLDETTARQVPADSPREKTRTPSIAEGGLGMEQREVTALCVDLTALAEIEAAVEEVRRMVARDGGTVVLDHPEYVVALFGLTDADGRDAEAAVRSALKTRRVIRHLADVRNRRAGMAVRGIRVVVDSSGKLQEDEAFRQFVLQLRDTASRCPGQVVTDRATHRHLAGRFETSEVSEPTAAAGELVAIEDEKPAHAVTIPMFGRREAIKTIAEHLAAVSSGSLRVVSLVGDAGIGRSRLLAEVAQRLRNRYDAFWYEARCARQQVSQPYSALSSMLRSVLGIDETDPQTVVREHLPRLRELGCLSEEVEAVGVALGIPAASASGPADRARSLRGAFVRIVGALAAEKVTILVVQGAAWIDADSANVLDGLARHTGRMRALVFLTYRTGEEMRWRGLPCHREITLGALAEADCQRLVLALLDNPQDPPWQLLRDVIQKSGGNPLFIEEYIRALEASGALVREGRKVVYVGEAGAGEIPRTLRGVFGARIAQLEPEHRAILRVAAVIGPRFPVDLLAHVMGMGAGSLHGYLEEFERRGIAARLSLAEYAFVHDLLRDIAYDSLTYADRKDLHERVARSIEALYGERVSEFYEVLATHYRESGSREKAVEFLIRNGERLAREYSHEAALHQYLKAIDLMRNAPQPDHRLILAAYHRVGELAIPADRAPLGIEKMRLAADLAEELGDRRALVTSVTLIGRLATKDNRFGEALRHLTRALELSEGLTDLALRRDILGAMGQALTRNAEHLQAERYLSEAIELAVATEDRDTEASLHLAMANSCAARNDREGAMASFAKAEQIISRKGNMTEIGELYKTQGLIHFMLRELDEARAATEKAFEIAKSYDFAYLRAVCSHNIGDSHLRQGNLAKAFTYLYSSLQICEQEGFEKLKSLNLVFVGYIDAVRLKSDKGVDQIRSAVRFAEEKGYVWDVIQGKYFLGRACYELGKFPEAKAALDEALRLGRTTGNKVHVEESEELLSAIEAIEAAGGT